VLLAVFLITFILLRGGRDYINKRNAEVKQKVSVLRLMQSDIKSAINRFPEHTKSLNQVLEALRYSDPISNSSTAVYDDEIMKGIDALSEKEGNGKPSIPEKCASLLVHIADVNAGMFCFDEEICIKTIPLRCLSVFIIIKYPVYEINFVLLPI
jgi:hypothetical protein